LINSSTLSGNTLIIVHSSVQIIASRADHRGKFHENIEFNDFALETQFIQERFFLGLDPDFIELYPAPQTPPPMDNLRSNSTTFFRPWPGWPRWLAAAQ
jgi:hypothetical protein